MEEQQAVQVEQDGSTESTRPMSVPEAVLLFDAIFANRQQMEGSEWQPNPLLKEAAEYAKRVVGVPLAREAINQMREVLINRHQFTESEATAVINLQLQSSDEARKLVPTLDNADRFSEEELETILQEVASFRT